jgi:hypothetical protein
MSLEHAPSRITVDGSPWAKDLQDGDFWFSLIDEKAAGNFLDVTDRTMQKYRQTGDGPPYILISSRCLKYRRADLRKWAEDRMRKSTSDPGQKAA